MIKQHVFFFALMTPFVTMGQVSEMRPLSTESVFANFGDYNKANDHVLYVAIDIDPQTKSFRDISLRIKNVHSSEERKIFSGINFTTPFFGWLDDEHVIYEFVEPSKKRKAFGSWSSTLMKYNIFSHEIDTVPSSWHTSSNVVRDMYVSDGEVFYTISYQEDQVISWMKYTVNTQKYEIVKQWNVEETDRELITYEYVPAKEEIIYVVMDEDSGWCFERLSLSSDLEEPIFETESSKNSLVSSTFGNGIFYYLVRVVPSASGEVSDSSKDGFVIKALDVATGANKEVICFSKGVEVTRIDFYKNNSLLISTDGGLKPEEVSLDVDFPESGTAELGMNPSSYLYILDLVE